jgi:hypothetical protein
MKQGKEDIQLDLQETKKEGVERIYLAEYTVKWRVLMHTVKIGRVP